MGIKIGIFGGGSIARKAYLPLLVSWPGVEIVGVYSRTAQTVEEICANWHIHYGTTEVNELIERGIQAAFVLTTQASHFEMAQKLLTEGIDVFVEKPATESSAQTRQLTDLARHHERVFMVSFNRRYAPLNQQAKDLFKQHQIDFCIIEKHRPSAYHTSLFNNYLDDTIHQIDLLCYYCKNPLPEHTSFQMKGGKLTGATSIARLTGGGIGIISTCLQAGAWQERVILHGDGLSVEVDAFRELRIKTGDHEVVYGNDRPGRWFPELSERGFSGAIGHFFECIQTRLEPATNGDEAVKSQVFMEKLVAIATPEHPSESLKP
jgi:virulence factor